MVKTRRRLPRDASSLPPGRFSVTQFPVSTNAKKPAAGVSRDPDGTRRRILDAALRAFATNGFAGARVDQIARRAQVNKRMLYHYFTDKKGLFRAVLRHKITERMGRIEEQAPKTGVASSLPLWFEQNCRDADYVRLLAWESLQTINRPVQDEEERRRISRQVAAIIKQKQASGRLRRDVPAEFLQLAKVSLAIFPMALPQLARLITGCSPHDSKFQRQYARFLETISAGFRPASGTVK